ncbi:hypothetical protein CAPTEDRAFT_211251 [Capitella teleta]|uniref:Nicotinamide-nucleotide adenylyltransferase n=1 Tax=Capitella teleta TaxID=283909 RepID=R7TIA0_CAPTE|nr:hypothetical protein CAPTEDRAFT_211251 [Capitella teleta]|eukprot:ELT93563.1 hypothetical protein CAPTEDRAFT_211251 [Capitella teleta]
MALPQKVVLLCCGSFNPITNMHLRMFELARDALDATGRYKVVGGIISPVNDAYTKPSLVSAKHRSTMIRLALQTSDWIKLDTWESEQESWLETLKVLKHHRESIESAFNANPPPDTPTKKRKLNSNMSPGMPRIKLLCGADLLSSFAEPGLWKDQDIEEIVGKYGIVCITRANAVNPENFIYDSDVLTLHRENIHIVTEWIHNEISSTKIRRALSRSKSIKYLVQDPVIEYIKENRLYSKSTLDK